MGGGGGEQGDREDGGEAERTHAERERSPARDLAALHVVHEQRVATSAAARER